MSDDRSSSSGPDDGPGPNDLDQLARRAVDAVMKLVRRGTVLAAGVLILVIVVDVGGFFLGIAALSDGMETVWIVLGGLFAFIAIYSVVVAMLRLWSVRMAADSLVTEVRSLIGGDRSYQRTVIETVESTDGTQNDGVVVQSRQFFSMKDAVSGSAGQFATLAASLRAVTTFPGFIALAVVITFVFAGLSIIFLLALAL